MLNHKNIKIGWVPITLDNSGTYSHDLDLLYFDPEKLSIQNNGLVSKCPAHTNFIKNFFVIRAPFDLKLTYDKTKDFIISENLTQEQYDRFIFPRFQDRGDDDKLNVTVNWRLLFVSDEPCNLEVYPAFMHGCPFNITVGSYDCFKWQRPIDFTFQIEENIDIKRGDPLYYISFRTTKQKNVNFVRLDWNKELEKALQQCNISKIQKKLSWTLLNNSGNIFRPKRFIK